MQLTIEIAAADAVHISQIGPIHSNQEVVPLVVLVPQLAGCFASAVDTMLGQLAAGRRVDLVAALLGAGG